MTKVNPFEVLYILKFGDLTKEEKKSMILSNNEVFINNALLILEAALLVGLIISIVKKR